MRMNNKESEKLNSLIYLAIEKNGGKDDHKIPFGLLANCLRECELHFDFPNQFPRVYQNRTVINYKFKLSDSNYFTHLKDCKYDLARLCEELLEDDYELPYDEDAIPIVDIKLVPKVSKLPVAPKITFEKCADVI